MLIALALVAALSDEVVTTAPRDSAVAEAMVAPAETPSGPVPSAENAQPHNLTTAEQIDHWIAARSSDRPTFIERDQPADDRKMHGWVEAGIGTEGYRSYGAAVSLPIGENGRLNLSYRESKNSPYGYWGDYGGYGYGYGYGYGPFGLREGRRSASASFSWNGRDRDRDQDRDRQDRDWDR